MIEIEKKKVGRPKLDQKKTAAEKQAEHRKKQKLKLNEKTKQLETEYVKISTYRTEMDKRLAQFEEMYKTGKTEEARKTAMDGLNALTLFDIFFNNKNNGKVKPIQSAHAN